MSCCHVDFFFQERKVKRGRPRPYPVLQEFSLNLPLTLAPSLSHYQPVDRISLSPLGSLAAAPRLGVQHPLRQHRLQYIPVFRTVLAIWMEVHRLPVSVRGGGCITLTKWQKWTRALSEQPERPQRPPTTVFQYFYFCSLLLLWNNWSETSSDIWVDTCVSMSGVSHTHFWCLHLWLFVFILH